MKLITQRGLILDVVNCWRSNYPPGKPWVDADKDIIGKTLAALDLSTVTAEQVNAIIGNGSWTSIRCNECGECVAAAVQVGEPPDYESATASVCESCLRKAVALFDGGTP